MISPRGLVDHLCNSRRWLGPGVIIADLAKIACEGKTVGVNNNAGIIEEASAAFPPSAAPNLKFIIADSSILEAFADNAFDIVHAHALLVHIPDPVSVLEQFYRICKPGGIGAVRESNPSTTLSLKPDLTAIRQYWGRAMPVMAKMDGHPDAGRKLETWTIEAGFGDDGGKILTSTSPQFQPSHIARMKGAAADQAIQDGMATKKEMDECRRGWEEWEATAGHEWIFGTGEILCWKGE